LQHETIKEIKTPFSSYMPSDNVLMMTLEFGMSNQYSRDLSRDVKRGNREKLEQGSWPGRAPFGYVNNKGQGTVSINKKVSPYIKDAFALYATGM